ncbi:MAG: addiction module protein [Verrucomicrobia bacterium]|nr:addiction module protein [Verrucomicrobiota bacterium]
MNATAEKLADQALALPLQERALLAHKLIASLDSENDPDAETQWLEVIDRRSREIDEGTVRSQPAEEAVRDIRAKLHASRRQPS